MENFLKTVNGNITYRVRKHGFCTTKKDKKEGTTTD